MKVAFYRGKGLYALLIRLWTRSRFAHCELVFSDLTMISAVEGVGVRSLNLTQDYIGIGWTVVDIPMLLEDEVAVRFHAEEELGAKYDWKGILLSQIIGLRRQHPSKWFCSEFCVAMLQKARICLGQVPHKESPGDLFRYLEGKGYSHVP